MIRLILKLVVAALVASAVWRIGSAYIAYFKFQDAVREAAVYEARSDSDLRDRIGALAEEFDVPIEAGNDDTVKIDRQDRHIWIHGSYVQPIELLPGYLYPWNFSWKIEADVAKPRTIPRPDGGVPE
jgi:hypothetical protein